MTSHKVEPDRWNTNMSNISNLFNPDTPYYMKKSIVIYAPFMDSPNHYIAKEVTRGIVTEVVTTPPTPNQGEFYGNYITLNNSETIQYGNDFDSFRKYKQINKTLDKNPNLELLSMKSLCFVVL